MVSNLNTARSNLLGDFNGLGFAIVYVPNTKVMAGPIGFAVPKKGGSGLESESLYLHEGVQFVDPDRWNAIADHPAHAARISKLIRSRILSVIKPNLKEDDLPTGTTLDFEHRDDAVFLVEHIFSLEWLRASYAQETARQDVKKACGDRIAAVSKMAADKKIPMSSLS